MIQFWIADVNSNPITDCTLASFTITFTRNGVTCTDPLTLVNNGGGSYCLEYTPSAAGCDVINIDDNVNDLHYCDIEVIDPTSDVLTLTQDYGGSGALKVGIPKSATYTLYVYNSSDWATGNTATYMAIAYTALDSSGNWLTPSLYVVPGTYHIVIRNGAGAVQVLKAYLQV